MPRAYVVERVAVNFGIVVSAALAGLLSFFSPCIVPLLPVYVGILTTDANSKQLSLAARCANTAAFVLGICFVFVSLGAGAGVLGQTLNSPYIAIALGMVVIVLGLHLAGVLNISFLNREKRANLGKIRVRSALGAFVLGLAFSFGWTPCVGPILGTILALAAEQGSALVGAVLLLVYALGLCVPFVVISLAANMLLSRLRALHSYLPAIQKAGGILIAIMGIWLVFSQVNSLVVQQRANDSALHDNVEALSANDVRGVAAGDADLDAVSSAWKNVVLTDMDGNKHRLSELKGSPVYFEFWGSWCDSCVADLGQLTEVANEHVERGDVQVVSVVTPGFYGERDADSFVAWARENGVSVPVWMDTNCSLATHLNVSAFPTSVFVNSEGDIVKIRLGAIDRDELESILLTLE